MNERAELGKTAKAASTRSDSSASFMGLGSSARSFMGGRRNVMKELISPSQSETVILIASVLLALGGAIWGYRVLDKRGLWAGLGGVLVYVLWLAHKYLTRYDAQSGYFGLDKVSVLLGEVVAFVVLGAVCGAMWSKITTSKSKETKENATDLL